MTSAQSVSIVVPAFNAVDYVGEAIESLLAQDYPFLEIIVVDDGSTDDTAAVVAAFGDRIVLHRQANAGQSAAMTTGWAMAKGEILGYVSADDRLLPEAVSRGVEALVRRPEIVLVYPDFDIIDERSVSQSTVRPPDFSRSALYGELHCLPGPGALFRRSAYETAGPWRSDLRQIPDLDFFLRLALQGDFYHLPEVQAGFRMHSQSTTYRAVPFERGEEPLCMIGAFFARSDLPPDVQSHKRTARAHALLLSAAIHGRSSRPFTAIRRLLAAVALDPATAASRKALGHGRLILTHARKPTRNNAE